MKFIKWLLNELDFIAASCFGPIRDEELNKFKVIKIDGLNYIIPRRSK